MTASFVCFSMWLLKNWIFFLLSTTTLQNLATQPTLFNNFSSKIFHIWVFNYADTISSRCLTRRLLPSRKLPRLHEGHLPKAGQQFTTTSLNTTTQTLPQDTAAAVFSPLWFQGRTFSRSTSLLPVFPCSWVSANRSVTTSHGVQPAETGSQWPRVALWDYCAPYSLEDSSKPLPSICKTNITTRQQGLLSSEIAVFTRKTTDYKQERLIRGDLETAGSPCQHLRRKAVHQLRSRMHWNTQIGNQSSI